jgi:drug/metabolite transporter (DMT)-like permease
VSSLAHGEARGLGLVAFSTVAYGLLPIFGKVAYGAGLRPLPLLAWRFVVAALLLALLARGSRPPLRESVRLWALGGVYVFNAVAYFRALEEIPASVTALVLYTYPMMVAVGAALVGLERLTMRGVLAALAAFAGCALTATGAPEGGRLPLSGVAWALGAALVYSSYLVLNTRFASGVPARILALHLAEAAALVSVGLALAGGGLSLPADPRAWLSVLGISVVSTVVAPVAFLAGMAVIGPVRAAVLSSVEVIVTLSLAASLLGERLSRRQWLGAALILGAVFWQNRAALLQLARRAPAGIMRAR